MFLTECELNIMLMYCYTVFIHRRYFTREFSSEFFHSYVGFASYKYYEVLIQCGAKIDREGEWIHRDCELT